MELMMKMKQGSWALHEASEHTGFIKKIVDGTASKEGYAEYLFNLSAMYKAIEDTIENNLDNEVVKEFSTKELYRYELIEKDLKYFAGEKYELLASTVAFVERMKEISDSNPELVVAYAYTRFLADLFGGRIFYSLLKDHYNINNDGLNYYSYKDLGDMKAYVMNYHNMLNTLTLTVEEKEEFIIEICNSYIYNMAISNELDSKCF
mgnify:CR=1 FL=1